MIGLYFEKDKNSKRKKLGKYKSSGEASTAAVDYVIKHRLPFEDAHHYKENGCDVYDMGIYGRIIIITE